MWVTWLTSLLGLIPALREWSYLRPVPGDRMWCTRKAAPSNPKVMGENTWLIGRGQIERLGHSMALHRIQPEHLEGWEKRQIVTAGCTSLDPALYRCETWQSLCYLLLSHTEVKEMDYSFIRHIFIEYLLCASHYSKVSVVLICVDYAI